MSAGIEIQIIAVLTAVACALPGVFLVLRKMSMMSDAITHTILLGIVLGFFVTQDLSSPVLLLGAALIGVITVWLTELTAKTRLVSEDSAIGLIFPLLFSVAIILISRYAGSVHLDTDSVLLGELAFAPFERMVVLGIDIGAKGMYTGGVILLLNILFIGIFFKELKLVTFDPILSAVIGFSPAVFHYSLMGMVSLTTVGAFEAVGSVLVVAFMIAPPATAYLLTDDLKKMIGLTAGFAAVSAIVGYQLAVYLDVSIAGSMAVTTGIIFMLVFFLAPKRGFFADIVKKKKQKEYFAENAFLLQIDSGVNAMERAAVTSKREKKIMADLRQKNWIVGEEKYALTAEGIQQVESIKKEWFPGFQNQEN
ncbi:metal ABC transporter permease [Scatolibacter rhodanostii]|uniref:metal ABC transporter permease n=1 Tax=Scatolibacter rhodanostii TaxID=2014781 RepID=UPI000C08D881|nr:metal ABC transporter permease [Scatolibacter rhodanostii]